MTLTSASSVLVTWNDQVADSFTLRLLLDSGTLFDTRHSISGTNYTFTGVPVSHQYVVVIYAVFDTRHGSEVGHNDIYITDCKLLLP